MSTPRNRVKGIAIDLCGIGGAGLVIAGLSLWSVPAAMIVAGILLLTIAVMGARAWV